MFKARLANVDNGQPPAKETAAVKRKRAFSFPGWWQCG